MKLTVRTANTFDKHGVGWLHIVRSYEQPPSLTQVIKDIKQKTYLHFDAFLKEAEILRIINDPHLVASNAFYPFLGYQKETYRFSGKKDQRSGAARTKKPRDIRYASRRDSAIYQAYRRKLAPLYEQKLKDLGIDDVSIAYRKIPVSDRIDSGKCNIHHACDVFEAIHNLSPCLAIALDIKSFFDHIDHTKLYDLWCNLLGEKKLPPDHLKVFKSVTNYAVVDLDEAVKVVGKPKDYRYVQLCSPQEFRNKVGPLAKKNKKAYGIPQGSPISDLLANLALLNFDRAIDAWIKSIGGVYKRYSDDIVLIIPTTKDDLEGKAQDANLLINKELAKAGEKLHISNKKTCCGFFNKFGTAVTYTPVKPFALPEDEFKNKPFEYLGFSFDGKKALLRNGTLSGFYRKLSNRTHAAFEKEIRRYPNRDLSKIQEIITPSQIIKDSLKIEDFHNKAEEYENWTFWSYATRAHNIMSKNTSFNSGIMRQLVGIRRKIRQIILNDSPTIYQHIKNSPSKRSKKLKKKEEKGIKK